MILALILFITTAQSVFQITKFYSEDTTCSNTETLWFVTQVTTCAASGCSNLNGQVGQVVLCTGTVVYPVGWTYIEIWTSSTTCGGVSNAFAAMPANGCSGIWTQSTFSLRCASDPNIGVIADCGISTPSCNGCSFKQAARNGTCGSGNPTTSLPVSSYKWTCPNVTTSSSSLATTGSTAGVTTTRPGVCSMLEVSFVMIAIWLIF